MFKGFIRWLVSKSRAHEELLIATEAFHQKSKELERERVSYAKSISNLVGSIDHIKAMFDIGEDYPKMMKDAMTQEVMRDPLFRRAMIDRRQIAHDNDIPNFWDSSYGFGDAKVRTRLRVEISPEDLDQVVHITEVHFPAINICLAKAV
jgi:hypothetical protein